MRLVIRRPEDPSFEVVLGDKPLSVGAGADNDVRLAGSGVAARHVLVSHAAIEALADVEVGGVRLRAGRRRMCVPSVLRLGATTLTIESVEESSVATRELVLRGLSGAASLWPRIIIVEGPSSGRELTLRSDRSYTVGRDPGCDLTVEDPQMSRAHFEIGLLEGALSVRASGSASGVWLGGSALEPRRKAAWPAHRMVKAGASVFAIVGLPELAKERATSETDAAAPSATAPEEPVPSTGEAAPIACIDEQPHTAAPVDTRSRAPFALRLAVIVFVIGCVLSLVALAYVLIL